MLTRNVLILSVIFNVVLLGAAVFLRLDNGSLSEQSRTLIAERDKAIAEAKMQEMTAVNLQKKLNVLSQAANNVDDDESREQLLKSIELKDEMIAALRQELQNTGRGNRERQAGNREQRGANQETAQERMERMQREDPERYAQITARRQQMEERAAKRDEFFSAIDLSQLPSRQRKTVSDYQELLRSNQELMQSAAQGDRESGREMWENQRAMATMSTEVRSILLEQYGRSIGATGSQLADQVNQILDMTSSGFGGAPGATQGGRGGAQGGRGGNARGRGGR